MTIPPPCLLLFHILFSAGLLFPLFLPSDSSLAAYDRDSGDVKIVVVNSSDADREYIFDLFAGLSARVRVVRTDNLPGGERWKEILGAARMEGQRLTFTAKAGTATTCVIGE